MKGVPSRGKIPDDLVVQNTVLINIAMTHTVLYFPACNQDSPSGRKLGIAQLGVMELHLDRVFSLGKQSPLKEITI